MLTILIGDGVALKREAIQLAVGREIVRFGEGGESFTALPAYLEQRGMFTPALALILDRPFDDEYASSFLLDEKSVVSADALLIVIQPDFSAALKKKLPKGAVVVDHGGEVSKKDEPRPNAFPLADALLMGERKQAWLHYRALIDAGISAEEIHGTLAWSARSVILAFKTKSAAEAEMSPYPYQKAQRVAARSTLSEAEARSHELVSLYHRARRGEGPLEVLLEVFLLKKH